jgi:hypothetical protein
MPRRETALSVNCHWIGQSAGPGVDNTALRPEFATKKPGQFPDFTRCFQHAMLVFGGN